MASTYTTRIGLEKQGDGENANTWGLKLNQNVIDLVDEAVAGYETIDLSSGAVSLTDTDGVPNQARNFGLKFTGALLADTTVTIPAKEKIYYIFNDTTEDYNIFIKPAGGTAVTVVDSGLGMIAGVDGSNINLLQSVNPDTYATKVQVNALSASLEDGSFVVGKAVTATNAASAANAGTLDGLDSTYFTNADNITSGILASSQLTGTYDISISGNAATATNAVSAANAGTVGGLAATAFVKNFAVYDFSLTDEFKNITVPVRSLVQGAPSLSGFGGNNGSVTPQGFARYNAYSRTSSNDLTTVAGVTESAAEIGLGVGDTLLVTTGGEFRFDTNGSGEFDFRIFVPL